MPEYIWQMVCGYMQDGVYHFPEGTLTIRNGFVVGFDWKEDESSDKEQS